VVISHGLAEHAGRYEHLAGRLVAAGYAVYAVDHRGHGRSGGPGRANLGRFDDVVTDLGTFVGRAQREHPGALAVLLGHSMGGLVALACALRNPKALRALVLSAPALSPGEAVGPGKALLARVLSTVAPNTGALVLPASAVSRDPAVVAAYERDPLVFHRSIPARTLVELVDGMTAVGARAHQLNLPLLVQHGSADRLVPLAAVRPVYQRLGNPKQRTLKVYEGLFHEVYNEPERERVIDDLIGWLEAVRH
jgi:acylglycerol lipase